MNNIDIDAEDEFDIANFAEQVIKEDREHGPTLVASKTAGFIEATGPDLARHPPAEDELVEAILQKGFGVKIEKKPEIKPKQVVFDRTVVESKDPIVYVQKLVKLIKEAQELINEMTDCGMIGTNQASGGFKVPTKTKIKKTKKQNFASILRKNLK